MRRGFALTVVAAEFAILFVSATLPTPLYPLYARAFGFGGITLTLIYAIYVLGNLIALLFFGRLSDQIGRKAATIPALAFALGSAIVFMLAEGTGLLFAARFLTGLATGLGAGTATAWIAELHPSDDKKAAAGLASAANMLGTAVGPLLAGALAQFAPHPLRLPYLVYLVLLLASAGVWVAPETVKDRKPLGEVALRPRLGVPKRIWLAFLPPALTAFATFALLGFYAALIPNLLSESLKEPSPLVAGAVVFELFLSAAVTAGLTARVAERVAMLTGLFLLPPSLALLVAAQSAASMPLLLAAAAVGGVAAAFGYRGSLGVINAIAPADQRSELVSSYLVAVYLGNSLPVVGIGFLTALSGSLTAHLVFAAIIALLAATAILTASKETNPTSIDG